MKTGIATIPLDSGKCPRWLFERMKVLGGLVAELIIEEFGYEEFLKRISHPVWFQSFGSLLAFDWNSSGLTVVLTAALKSAFKERNLGIYFAGGKGKTSLKTPDELNLLGDKFNLDSEKYIRLSKLIAKIDNSLIQDNFILYHHIFILTKEGAWAVIQQGMNQKMRQARRYHWCSYSLSADSSLDKEPHTGIVSNISLKRVLNLTAKESEGNKTGIVKIINEEEKELTRIFSKSPTSLFLPDIEFSYHPVIEEKFDLKKLKKTLDKIKRVEVKSFIDLLQIEGVGPKTIRALSLAAELIYGVSPSYKDPARYTFAHGGKDGTPYPVDKKTYDETIHFLNKAIEISKRKLI